ncbi:integrase [Rhizorhabdus dicambivorans]|uniref:Integrase n=1 Tax=Rhizorhabdus dicambivorans TaxID=1850238 RepID=A0A2A4FUT3_9SPHN|nr:integrase arm-type DNA-binding domain-containing protein [Rhizorhabdus dicambivorans]ATE65756.1 integrase [Rhizorhabdus dicambivorans]PCE41161.1 integrase [Rhizorhabdus dicambivorans]
MPLTYIQIAQAKAPNGALKLSDGRGLTLVVQPSGTKVWRLKYRYEGKQKTLHLGHWPKLGISEARQRSEEARKLITEGSDPALVKRFGPVAAKVKIVAGNSFRDVAEEWLEKCERDELSIVTINKIRWLLDKAYPKLGALPIEVIRPLDVLAVLKTLEAAGTLESARRLRSVISRIFRFGVATGRIERDVACDLRGAIATPKSKNLAAITTAREAGVLLRAIENYTGHEITAIALECSAHLFVRPGELRQAEWPEFDADQSVWAIPPEKTKMRRPHWVPLSRQMMAKLHRLHDLTGSGQHLFPCLGKDGMPMSENTVNLALRRLGFKADQMTAHGFRAMAATLLNESGQWHPDAIERQLAHIETNEVRRAYTRGEYWPERVRMMQWWSDHIEELRKAPLVQRSSFGSVPTPAVRLAS